MNKYLPAAFLALMASLAAQPNAPAQDASAIIEHAKSATVIILAGEGAGRLRSTATGVLVSKNGTILTALHVIKGAAEVQVRTANGETFDRVELLDSDERRDVAALRIPARETPALEISSATPAPGDRVYAVTNANGLAWSATEGILSALRLADEIPGAGSGFRVLEFNAPVAPGSSGGGLLNKAGALIGIITSSRGNAAFAVPVDSVLGLTESGRRTPLGSGSSLQMPKPATETPSSGAAIAGFDPKRALKEAKTVFVRSKTMFLTVDTVDRALANEKDWPKLGLTIVQDQRVADIVIEIDRPLFTYVHTFVVIDKRTSAVLGSGKVTAFDGTIASGPIANDIIKLFAAARAPQSPSVK